MAVAEVDAANEAGPLSVSQLPLLVLLVLHQLHPVSHDQAQSHVTYMYIQDIHVGSMYSAVYNVHIAYNYDFGVLIFIKHHTNAL